MAGMVGMAEAVRCISIFYHVRSRSLGAITQNSTLPTLFIDTCAPLPGPCLLFTSSTSCSRLFLHNSTDTDKYLKSPLRGRPRDGYRVCNEAPLEGAGQGMRLSARTFSPRTGPVIVVQDADFSRSMATCLLESLSSRRKASRNGFSILKCLTQTHCT